MNNMLPIKMPYLYGKLTYAFPLTILSAYANHDNLMLNNFNNLVELSMNDERLNLDFAGSHITTNAYWPFLSYEMIRTESLPVPENQLAEYIIRCLDQNKYFYCFLDKYFVSGTHPYQNYHFRHNALIYGYDLTENCFHIASYDQNNMYSTLKVPVSEVLTAFYYDDEKFDPGTKFVFLIKYNPEGGYEADLRRMVQGIAEYLDPKPLQSYLIPKVTTQRLVSGHRVYDRFVFFLRKQGEGERDFTNGLLINSHVIMEHKKVINWKLSHLIDRYGYTFLEGLLREFQQVEEHFLASRMLMMKYRATQDRLVLDELVQLVEEVKEQERDVLQRFVHLLRDKV